MTGLSVGEVSGLIAAGVFVVAAIVTPLGLYSSIEPADSPTTVAFSYSKDPSAFGDGTPPRSSWPFTGVCGNGIPCPGTTLNETCAKQGLLQNCTISYDPRIPAALGTLFSDGASSFSPSVSSIFDIQWRTYVRLQDAYSTFKYYMSAGYRQLETLILNEGPQVIEGLIVDMDSGGIGFRNHSIPTSILEYGATWEEDILFVQPETQCVNLNVTLDFQYGSTTSNGTVVLTDRGGFSALSRQAPSMNLPSNAQGKINLQQRAYNAAWLNNFLTLVYFNATGENPSNITRLDVTRGQNFPVDNSSFSVYSTAVQSSLYFGSYLNFNKTNPYNISANNFQIINNICGGTSPGSPANIDSSIVGCAVLYGAATRIDGGSNLIIDPLSKWSAPIYSCASAVRAKVQTVSFRYNGTGLGALKATSIKPKTYSNPSSFPRWAVQNLDWLQFSDAMPMWGILGSANSSQNPLAAAWNMSTIAAESLYLPGFMDWLYITSAAPVPVLPASQNLPALNFYSQALYTALNIGPPSARYSGYQGYADYSGWSSLGVYAKWQKLSTSAETVSQILNLVWTDVAANAVVGTRGWGLTSAASTDPTGFAPSANISSTDVNTAPSSQIPVVLYHQKIRYRLPFAVPAFVTLAITLVVLIMLLLLAIRGKTGVKQMRKFLDATSMGRITARLLWKPVLDQETKSFVNEYGKRHVTITYTAIILEEGDAADEPEKSDESNQLGEDATSNLLNW
ncbi:hypothetical protein PENSUB_728 [Penicillium subrubescens]|uniref:Uncharacterized protein n=1 Tax=Penicillium subrubescens TaxID=1316194 RepID=A0A1Q5UM38_9EURO|nr:hypothetical protein PENSUB_728 [Penicillium subrubescens]